MIVEVPTRDTLLEKLVKEVKNLGVELPERELEIAVSDILRWLGKSYGHGLVPTEDGSYTLIHECGEPYHSLSAGALTEALEKFVRPVHLLLWALRHKTLTLIDMGFGLGYNSALFFHISKRVNPQLKLNIIAFDKEVPKKIPLLPEPFKSSHKRLLDLLPEGYRDGLSFKLYLGDARKTLKGVLCEADFVFHDPFSPFKNPELWTLDFLKKLASRLKPTGFWVSYSSALPVRKALILLGMKVSTTRPVGRSRGGTLATYKSGVLPLTWKEREKLLKSPYSLPFRDPTLGGDPLDILIDYRLRVALKKYGLDREGT